MSTIIKVTPTTYERDGIAYDRITEVIGKTWPQPDLQDWRATVGKARANRDLKHGEHIGTMADAAITAMLSGLPPKKVDSVEVRQALRGFSEWHHLNPLSVVSLQVPLLNDLRRIGGTPDCLTLHEGFDWKTSARFNFTQILQADQYWRLAEQHGFNLRCYRLVRFDKILGIWEELLLEQDPVGVVWQGRWFTRQFLGETFQTLLNLYRQWQYVSGQGRTLADLSIATSTCAPLNGESTEEEAMG